MNKIVLIIALINFLSTVRSQNDFALTDINPFSDTYDQLIGPSYFSNEIIVIGFFHEY